MLRVKFGIFVVPMSRSTRPAEEKSNLHPRNRHRNRYDFPALIRSCPELERFVSLNPYQDLSIDFKDPQAVKVLNKALLKHFYDIRIWNIPEGYLCPPIPGRADYLHYVADLLADENEGNIPVGSTIKVLDIGVGANCIYPLVGVKEYGWRFVGSEIDPGALRSAKNIVDVNGLSGLVTIRKQGDRHNILKGAINPGESFDLVICNPPFFSSLKEASENSSRKWKNLNHQVTAKRNFGGQNSELWCEGGESRFVRQMIAESTSSAAACLWFTTLISSKETLSGCYRALEKVKACEVKTIPMSQGQKVSRILAWTFLDPLERAQWQASRWQVK